MDFQKISKQDMSKMSMIELASVILADLKKEMNFLELYDDIAKLKQLTKEEKTNYLSQFYTDLNMDGRFIALGSSV